MPPSGAKEQTLQLSRVCIDLGCDTAYTECINLMDYRVAVIPVTKDNKYIDLFDNDYAPLNEVDRMNWQSCKSVSEIPSRSNTWFSLAHITRQDDPETYHGAPVGLQIVTRKHEEEKVWAIAKIVDCALKMMG